MNSRSSCPNEGVVPIRGVKLGSQFLSQIDPGTSGTSGSPKKLKLEKTSENSMAENREHEEYDHQHNCGWYPDDDYLWGMKDELESQMAEMEDDKNLMCEMGSVSGVVVTIPVTCPECDEEIEVNAEVDADIMWEEEEPDYRLPNIEGYDITDLRVLSPEVPTFPTDVMDAAYDSLQPDVEDYDYEDQDDLHFNIPDEVLEEPSEIDLDIIGETRMKKGRCVMGLDKRNRLLRPINRTLPNSCCWSKDKNFKVWNRYRFKVLRHPDATTEAPTPFPHSTEDTVVEENTRHMEKADRSSLFNRMLSIAVSKPEEIFGPLQDKKFVNKDTKCCSVGIVKCKERNITVKPNRYAPAKKRLVMNLSDQGVCDFSLTGLEYDEPGQNDNTVLVLLGLARPWDRNCIYSPARCYVLALNIIKQGD